MLRVLEGYGNVIILNSQAGEHFILSLDRNGVSSNLVSRMHQQFGALLARKSRFLLCTCAQMLCPGAFGVEDVKYLPLEKLDGFLSLAAACSLFQFMHEMGSHNDPTCRPREARASCRPIEHCLSC